MQQEAAVKSHQLRRTHADASKALCCLRQQLMLSSSDREVFESAALMPWRLGVVGNAPASCECSIPPGVCTREYTAATGC